jgi:coenzyme F420-reducing hydrogenase gamma subunit
MTKELPATRRPRAAFVSFTSCEGCQLTVLSLEDQFPVLAKQIEIVWFREAMDERSDEYDIAFVEGSITREEEVQELKEIRSRARYVVALGACATLGGVNALRQLKPVELAQELVYGPGSGRETGQVRRIADVIKVDYAMHGCPIDDREFLRVVTTLLMGVTPREPTSAVCIECKRKANVCLYDLGQICFGPIARAGCGAVCPTFRSACEACRGFIPGANLRGMVTGMRDHGASDAEIRWLFERYNALTDLTGLGLAREARPVSVAATPAGGDGGGHGAR